MPQLVDVLAEVLRSFGYRATVDAHPAAGEPAYEVPLWAEKDASTVAIEFWYESEPPSAWFLEGFRSFLAETRADRGILVDLSTKPLSDAEGAITVWGADHLRTILGGAVLDETCPGLTERRDPLQVPVAESPWVDEPRPAEPEPGAAGAFDMFDVAADESPAEAPVLEASEETPEDAPEQNVDESPFELLPTASEPEKAEPTPEQAPEPVEDESPFELLRIASESEEAEPEAGEAPESPDDESPFELLPAASQADQPEETMDPEGTLPAGFDLDDESPVAGDTADFEELPGRPRDTRSTPEPVAPSTGAAAGTDFELLAGRAEAASPDAPADDASSGAYDELPGRKEQGPADDGPAIPISAEGSGYEELPGRHDEPPPEESAGSFDATGTDGRDFEVIDGEEESQEEDGSRPAAAPGDGAEFRVPAAFADEGPEGEPGVLKLQVSRRVAHNLVKDKLRRVREDRLRLIPFEVFSYEADVLVDGRLDAETKRGRVGVDAWMKRAQVWDHGTETAPLDAGGAEVEPLKVRLDREEARRIVLSHLEELVGREITEEQEGDDWSVVVKRRVRLAEEDVRIRYDGTYWLPVWRLSGAEGAVEIDAAGGQVLEEEILVEQTDSQLL